MNIFRSVLNFCELPLVSVVRHMQILKIFCTQIKSLCKSLGQLYYVFMKIKSAVAKIYVNTGEIFLRRK